MVSQFRPKPNLIVNVTGPIKGINVDFKYRVTCFLRFDGINNISEVPRDELERKLKTNSERIFGSLIRGSTNILRGNRVNLRFEDGPGIFQAAKSFDESLEPA